MKIYLAKSNKCNPSDYMRARFSLISNSSVELVEYSGGSYSDFPLKQSDKLLVLPQNSQNPFVLGKGLCIQIKTFLETNQEAYIITDVNNLTVVKISLKDIQVIDYLDYVNHAAFKLNDEHQIIELSKILPTIIKKEETEINYGDIIL